MTMNKLKDTVAIRFVYGECRVKLMLGRQKSASLNVGEFIELVRSKLGKRLGMCPQTQYGLFERFDNNGIEQMVTDSTRLVRYESSSTISSCQLVVRPKRLFELQGFGNISESRLKKCYKKLSAQRHLNVTNSTTTKRVRIDEKPFEIDNEESANSSSMSNDTDRCCRLQAISLKLASHSHHRLIAKRRRTTTTRRCANGLVVDVVTEEECMLIEKQSIFAINY